MPAIELVRRASLLIALAGIVAGGIARDGRAADFDSFLKPLLAQKCAKCHGEEEVNGEVNFEGITTAKLFLEKPKLINRMIGAIDANDMPPEDEPQLDESTRAQLLATLKTMLRDATAGKAIAQSIFKCSVGPW